MSLHKDLHNSVNLSFQDEARFGLRTEVGIIIPTKAVTPKVKFYQKFKNIYLYGAYSPINRDLDRKCE